MDKAFWYGLGMQALPVVLPILLTILYIGVLKFLEKRRAWQDYVRFALCVAQQTLGDKLGDRGKHVFDAWLHGLDSIKDGNLSRKDVIDILVYQTRATLNERKETITKDEDASIRTTAENLVEMLSLKSIPSRNQAIHLLSTNH